MTVDRYGCRISRQKMPTPYSEAGGWREQGGALGGYMNRKRKFWID